MATQPDGSHGTVTITGRDANLLLFMLDDYIAGKWQNGRKIDGYPEDQLDRLRETLFAGHEHPPET